MSTNTPESNSVEKTSTEKVQPHSPLHIVTREKIQELMVSGTASAPDHCLQHPTPKFEDIQRVTLSDFDKVPGETKEEFDALMKESVRGRYVIDLGAGRKNDAYNFAWYFGAEAYVAIEANHEYCSQLRQSIEETQSEKQPALYIKEGDILDVLRRLPNECGNIFIIASGIDDLLLDFTGSHPEYIQQMKHEILRVLPCGGRLLTYASFQPDPTFHRIGGLRLTEGDFAIWEKDDFCE